MHEWVQAVKRNKSVAGLIPVDAPPTLANARALEGRLHFLRQEVSARHSGELKCQAAKPKPRVRPADKRKRFPNH